MNYFAWKKIITVVCLVVVSATVFQPRPAQALFPDWLNAAIQVIGHGIQGGLLAVDSAFNGVSAALDSVKAVMDGLPIQYGPVRQGLSITMASCDLLGGKISAIGELDNLLSPVNPGAALDVPDSPLYVANLPKNPSAATLEALKKLRRFICRFRY